MIVDLDRLVLDRLTFHYTVVTIVPVDFLLLVPSEAEAKLFIDTQLDSLVS